MNLVGQLTLLLLNTYTYTISQHRCFVWIFASIHTTILLSTRSGQTDGQYYYYDRSDGRGEGGGSGGEREGVRGLRDYSLVFRWVVRCFESPLAIVSYWSCCPVASAASSGMAYIGGLAVGSYPSVANIGAMLAMSLTTSSGILPTHLVNASWYSGRVTWSDERSTLHKKTGVSTIKRRALLTTIVYKPLQRLLPTDLCIDYRQ